MTIVVRWLNGNVDSAPSPARLLKDLADAQWNYTPHDAIKRELSDRAWTVGGVALDPELDALDFLRAMERHGICEILAYDPPPVVD